MTNSEKRRARYASDEKHRANEQQRKRAEYVRKKALAGNYNVAMSEKQAVKAYRQLADAAEYYMRVQEKYLNRHADDKGKAFALKTLVSKGVNGTIISPADTPTTANELKRSINALRDYLTSKTSTVKGVREIGASLEQASGVKIDWNDSENLKQFETVYNQYVKYYGTPSVIYADRGVIFAAYTAVMEKAGDTPKSIEEVTAAMDDELNKVIK